MPTLKVGLAPYKNSFYDKKTNTYITLESPVADIYYDDQTDLLGICHAVNCKYPALVLYQGKFPKVVLNEWKKKYELVAKQALNRADENQNNSEDNEESEPDPEPETLNIISIDKLDSIQVDFGTEESALSLPSQVKVTLSDDSIKDLNVSWDSGSPSYDGNSSDSYTFKGALTLSGDMTNTDNLVAEIVVEVLEDESEPDVEALALDLDGEESKKKSSAKKTATKKSTKKSTK